MLFLENTQLATQHRPYPCPIDVCVTFYPAMATWGAVGCICCKLFSTPFHPIFFLEMLEGWKWPFKFLRRQTLHGVEGRQAGCAVWCPDQLQAIWVLQPGLQGPASWAEAVGATVGIAIAQQQRWHTCSPRAPGPVISARQVLAASTNFCRCFQKMLVLSVCSEPERRCLEQQ